ncbi:MAG: hypothetical protein ABSG43_06675 [Solirubrobacteraceae bacterium]
MRHSRGRDPGRSPPIPTGVPAAAARALAALRQLERLGGPIAELRLTGGWAANPVVRRLKEREFPNTVYPAVSEAGARGAALLAGMAAGLFDSVDDFPPVAVIRVAGDFSSRSGMTSLSLGPGMGYL